ncbi:hypothetical protein ACFE04_011716 [Oxalis oulophora]
MGKKTGTLYINSKKFTSMNKPCMKEMISFLNCLTTNKMSDENCARQKELLGTCMDAQTSKNRKSWGSINYQLQRLSRDIVSFLNFSFFCDPWKILKTLICNNNILSCVKFVASPLYGFSSSRNANWLGLGKVLAVNLLYNWGLALPAKTQY